MSYIRGGCKLPSGKESGSYVVFDGKVLVNYSNRSFCEFNGEELKRLLKEKSDSEIKKTLKKKLGMSKEETEVVCERLFREREEGEWD